MRNLSWQEWCAVLFLGMSTAVGTVVFGYNTFELKDHAKESREDAITSVAEIKSDIKDIKNDVKELLKR